MTDEKGRISRALEQLRTATNDDLATRQALQCLQDVTMTVDLLRVTKVAITLKSLKRCMSPSNRFFATRLIKTWKQMVLDISGSLTSTASYLGSAPTEREPVTTNEQNFTAALENRNTTQSPATTIESSPLKRPRDLSPCKSASPKSSGSDKRPRFLQLHRDRTVSKSGDRRCPGRESTIVNLNQTSLLARRGSIDGSVLPLSRMCIEIMAQNIQRPDILESLCQLPATIAQGVVELAKPSLSVLKKIESWPMFADSDNFDSLWRLHTLNSFPNVKEHDKPEGVTWKEYMQHIQNERQRKLDNFGARARQAMQMEAKEKAGRSIQTMSPQLASKMATKGFFKETKVVINKSGNTHFRKAGRKKKSSGLSSLMKSARMSAIRLQRQIR